MVEIVAELSGNHGGSLNKMLYLIERAAWCGCDYAKFQLYRPEDMPDRQEGNNQEMYEKLAVPETWLDKMFLHANRHHIGLFASVFSARAVVTLLKFDVPYIKLASPESTRLADTTYHDIRSFIPGHVGLIVSGNWDHKFRYDLAMLCPSGHPPNDIEIWEHLRRFDSTRHFGFSDHTPGIQVPLAFIRAGARMIEKHFKENDADCIDLFSAHPTTMKTLCRLAHNQ